MKHGYTNRTFGDGAVVRKTYEGPDAALRLHRERALLTALRGLLPVPPVRAASADALSLGQVAGVRGQELLDAGQAPAVLAACGEMRRFCERWEPGGPGVRQWEERAAATAGWTE